MSIEERIESAMSEFGVKNRESETQFVARKEFNKNEIAKVIYRLWHQHYKRITMGIMIKTVIRKLRKRRSKKP